ncbi:SusC/RagA family TonB-linked outer membrane protein [Saccharicrinis fermentans]|uniref:Outer membrane cobalamin receptor protein n=1 Tax=Saccharicrinis fermentans DSM 9555 = JCM 21142 TaxID=869213 RepID=W7Y3Y3_9BACT|nr:SusC/RagA family TonB-linked outer membrane protein [Saccharicrinis fermentans]GAF02757.1 outer membrane cobalamin receptor protein [Saccharicrinis fermentans DSM 9555 = JCM 21142]
MKTKRFLKYLNVVLFALVLVFPFGDTIAQKNKTKRVEVSSKLEDASGNAISGATIYANEGATVVKSDADGKFTTYVKRGTVILIEAEGYTPKSWDLSNEPVMSKIVLQEVALKMGAKDMVNLPLGHQVSQRMLVGAVSRIEGRDLERYADPLLRNSLQGMAAGLNVIATSGGMANNPASLYVRGLSRNSSNTPLFIVDGIERSFDDINPEEVENVEILKDATSKILYGSRAANGVVLLTTRRGEAHKRVIDAKVDFGVGLTTRMPAFINSAEYATLYNEARVNDGLTPLYSSEDIANYQNSTGENDLLYPNADYYDYFLRDYTTFSKATLNVSGGNKNAQYAFMAGYMGYGGLQKIGPDPRQDRFNIRINLDMDITRDISAFINMSAIMDSWKYSGLDHSSTFSALSSHRPNEYPFIIGEEYIEATDDGVPALGASYQHADNLLASLNYQGDGNNQFINQQMTTGFDFDLHKVTEGLYANVSLAFDNYFYGSQVLAPKAATYVPVIDESILDENGSPAVGFELARAAVTDTKYDLNNKSTLRTTAFNGKLGYKKDLGVGVLNASLGYFHYMKEVAGSSIDIENDNLFLRANYSIKNKYVIEGSLSYMGSNRFIEDNRHFLSPAIGAAWILSEESFLDIDAIDYLKAKASFGILGYDRATSSYLYENLWLTSGSQSFGEQNKGDNPSKVSLVSWGNPDLEWEKSREINIGLEGMAFDRRLAFEVNYFNEYRYDMVDQVDEQYAAMVGPFKYYTNYQEVVNNGFELDIDYMNTIGELSYRVGANYTYSKNNFKVKDEVNYSDDRATEGRPTSVIMGYESLGLFGKDVALEGAPKQMFGSYGVGDIAYKDQNGDNIIDDLDKVEVGLDTPTSFIGIDVELKYKKWGLYALGTASLGGMKTLSNTYYRNNGESKYSKVAYDAYHPTRNPNGTQPSLTTTSGANNTVTSDFWTKSGDFFRLKNVEVSYTLDFALGSAVKKSKFFVRGNNLLVLSDMKDLDPEAPNSGVTNYPVIRMITGGVSVSF